jgi:hypothetical protein
MTTPPTEKSAVLADEERKKVIARQEEIGTLMLQIETLLIEADCTWQDWHNIVNVFNDRNEQVIPKITIKEIKQRYGQPK